MVSYPAPWRLTGSGIILPYWLDKTWLSGHFPGRSGRLGIAMWVNYQTSPVGPYREWLFVPATLKNPRGKHYSISHILVDYEASMFAGRENWGIPKHLGEFQWQQQNREYAATLKYQDSELLVKGAAKGPLFPLHSGLLPFSLYQQYNQQHFWTRPKATGWGRWMNITQCEFKGEALPDLSAQKRLGAFVIPRFEMVFAPAITQAE